MLVQIIIIAVLVSIVQTFTGERQHAFIDDSNDVDMSSKAEDFISDSIWELIEANIPNVDKNNIDDIVIREGTYEEIENDDGSVSVNFIVDIDSLKQTYTVSTGWTKDKSTIYEVIVDCPQQKLMKYPETVCQGTYNNTYSLDLYLPYVVDSENEDATSNVYVYGNENDKTINVEVSACDPEKYKKMAMDYLESTPIKLSDYTINYEVSYTDIECG
ncbi:hypothetical protein IKF92_01430 [Candidatus Saccharibacteria bacterium]|nr:hypothetical protein [Candidatus Saccharibacteria bacterium]